MRDMADLARAMSFVVGVRVEVGDNQGAKAKYR
jgi:hypothetical protein